MPGQLYRSARIYRTPMLEWVACLAVPTQRWKFCFSCPVTPVFTTCGETPWPLFRQLRVRKRHHQCGNSRTSCANFARTFCLSAAKTPKTMVLSQRCLVSRNVCPVQGEAEFLLARTRTQRADISTGLNRLPVLRDTAPAFCSAKQSDRPRQPGTRARCIPPPVQPYRPGHVRNSPLTTVSGTNRTRWWLPSESLSRAARGSLEVGLSETWSGAPRPAVRTW